MHIGGAFGRILLSMIMAGGVAANACGGGGRGEASGDRGTNRLQLTSEPVTITWWAPNTYVYIGLDSFSDMEFYRMLERETGVTVEFVHPARQVSLENAFRLMLDAGDVPDIVEFDWRGDYENGPDAAIEDGIIVPLGPLVDAFSPNLKTMLQEHPEIDATVRTQRGTLYAYPHLAMEPELRNYQVGPVVRTEWLEAVGLSVPETISDWEEMLQRFRDSEEIRVLRDGDEIRPFTLLADARVQTWGGGEIWAFITSNLFAGAYATSHYYYPMDGDIHFGPIEQSYREVLALLHSWYLDGLLYLDLNDAIESEEMVASTGAFLAGQFTVGEEGWWQESELTPVPYPVHDGIGDGFVGPMTLPANDPSSLGASITTANTYPDVTARLLDLGYGRDGIRAYGFGVEDVTYRMGDDGPVFLDEIAQNARQAFAGALNGNPRWYVYGYPLKIADHTRGLGSGPFAANLDARRQAGMYTNPSVWFERGGWYDFPHYFVPPEYENNDRAELAAIESELDDYIMRTLISFIRGEEPLDFFDRFVSTVESMGIRRAVDILNRAQPWL